MSRNQDLVNEAAESMVSVGQAAYNLLLQGRDKQYANSSAQQERLKSLMEAAFQAGLAGRADLLDKMQRLI